MFLVNYDTYDQKEKERQTAFFQFEIDADEFMSFMNPHNNAVMEEVSKTPKNLIPVNPVNLEGMRDQHRNKTFNSDILHGDQFPEYCKGIELYRKLGKKPK